MTDFESAAIAKWPNVPACYGWLSLGRRGVWRLKDEPVVHSGLNAFLNAHYRCDDAGNWFVQNGPQRVFVALDYMPLVLRFSSDGGLVAHTGMDAGLAESIHLDSDGSVLVITTLGPALLDDRELAGFLAECKGADGLPASETALLEIMAGGAGASWRGAPLQAIQRSEVSARFRFNPAPSE
jgi:hypothetical protein